MVSLFVSNVLCKTYLFSLAVLCNKNGNTIPPGLSPPLQNPVDATPSNPWHPFPNQLGFKVADIHFTEQQSLESDVNQALDFWLALTLHAGGDVDDIP
jgi:hypothetical protein